MLFVICTLVKEGCKSMLVQGMLSGLVLLCIDTVVSCAGLAGREE